MFVITPTTGKHLRTVFAHIFSFRTRHQNFVNTWFNRGSSHEMAGAHLPGQVTRGQKSIRLFTFCRIVDVHIKYRPSLMGVGFSGLDLFFPSIHEVPRKNQIWFRSQSTNIQSDSSKQKDVCWQKQDRISRENKFLPTQTSYQQDLYDVELSMSLTSRLVIWLLSENGD